MTEKAKNGVALAYMQSRSFDSLTKEDYEYLSVKLDRLDSVIADYYNVNKDKVRRRRCSFGVYRYAMSNEMVIEFTEKLMGVYPFSKMHMNSEDAIGL